MINPSEENLLGYLIRANEEHEQEELAEQIRIDAKLRKDCQLLQTGLTLPAADEEHLDPPSHLAMRTCSKLWNMVDSGEFPKLPSLTKQNEPTLVPAAASLPVAMAATPAASSPRLDNQLAKPKRRWHWLDLAVASTVLVVIGGVLSTQILASRTQAMRLSCQNNLQLTYASYADYARLHGGKIPTATERGPTAFAGMVGPTMRHAGLIKNQRNLICPESALAKDLDVQLPTLPELEHASPEELPALQRRAGGTYSYAIGYFENGKYQVIKLRNRPNYALISDPPASDKRSGNHHGQTGQNILYDNGSCRFTTECQIEGCRDHHFLNDAGLMAPGLHADDAVLVDGDIAPLR